MEKNLDDVFRRLDIRTQSKPIHFEERLKRQAISPERETDRWIYNNLEAMGNSELSSSSKQALALVNKLRKSHARSLDKCQRPVTPTRWEKCRSEVTKAQTNRDQDYLKAKQLAYDIMKWYYTPTVTEEELKEIIKNHQPPLLRDIEKRRLHSQDYDCPFTDAKIRDVGEGEEGQYVVPPLKPRNKKIEDIREEDFIKCQQSLSQAQQDQVKFRLAQKALEDGVLDWLMNLPEVEKDFQTSFLEHLEARDNLRPLVIPRRRRPPGTETEKQREAREQIQQREDEKLLEARGMFYKERAYPLWKRLFAYQPNQFIDSPETLNKQRGITSSNYREKVKRYKQLLSDLTQRIQTRQPLSNGELDEWRRRLVQEFGTKSKNYPDRILELFRQAKSL